MLEIASEGKVFSTFLALSCVVQDLLGPMTLTSYSRRVARHWPVTRALELGGTA